MENDMTTASREQNKAIVSRPERSERSLGKHKSGRGIRANFYQCAIKAGAKDARRRKPRRTKK
jgi:hypothetical protein